MSFHSELIVKSLHGGDWVLFRPLIWQTREGRITVPAGFVTDLASVPQALRSFASMDDTQAPAVLHDWLYRKGIGTRAEADRLLFDAMRSKGAGWFKARAWWLAVRLGGWISWKG